MKRNMIQMPHLQVWYKPVVYINVLMLHIGIHLHPDEYYECQSRVQIQKITTDVVEENIYITKFFNLLYI